MGKESKKKLTDAYCKSLPRLDKRYFKPGDYPGLQICVLPSGTKTWYFQYKVKGKKYQERKNLGKYPTVGVVEAIKKAKIISGQLFEGNDPKEQIKSDILKMQFGEALRKYFEELSLSQTAKGTIKSIKATFKPWIFRDTYDSNILELLSRVEDIQYKRLHAITPKMFKNLYRACGGKSPIVANRMQEYCRLFWNDFVKAEDNPFILKKKNKYVEKVYLDYLDQNELPRVMANLVRIDERSGRLNSNYYETNYLNPVSCLVIALQLTTGRRPGEANSLRHDNYLKGVNPRLQLDKTKTSRRNRKLVFNLGDDAVKVLNLILKDRLNNPGSAFYYPINDERNKYIFPSRTFGKKIGKYKHTSPHIKDVDKTWSTILKMSGVERPMHLHATRHTFATNFYRVTKDIKALAEALGTTEQIALKYAKLVNETVVEGINKINFFNDEKPILKQVN